MSSSNPAHRNRRVRRGRVATAIGLAGVTAISARVATGAGFSGPRSASQGATAAGDLSLTLANGDSGQAVTVAVSDLYPNGVRQRVIDVTNGASLPFKTLGVFIATDCGGCNYSLIDGDAIGVALAVENCTSTWTPSGSSPDRTYTCADAAGGTYGGAVVKASTPVHNLKNDAGLGLAPGTTDLTTNSRLTVNAVNHYLLTFSLPNNAPAVDMSTQSIYGFKFQGTQRDGLTK